jgi:hypothetical protein
MLAASLSAKSSWWRPIAHPDRSIPELLWICALRATPGCPQPPTPCLRGTDGQQPARVQGCVLAVIEQAITGCGHNVCVNVRLMDWSLRLLQAVNWHCLTVEPALPLVLGLCQVAAEEELVRYFSGFPQETIRRTLKHLLLTCGTAHAWSSLVLLVRRQWLARSCAAAAEGMPLVTLLLAFCGRCKCAAGACAACVTPV